MYARRIVIALLFAAAMAAGCGVVETPDDTTTTDTTADAGNGTSTPETPPASAATLPETTTTAPPATTDGPESTLGPGGTEDIATLQTTLADLGYYEGPIDGITGPETQAAIREFQEFEDLTVNGRVDEPTAAALITAVANDT